MHRALRTSAAACWLATVCAAAAGGTSSSDEALAALQAAYARSVAPGEAAQHHQALWADVVLRLQRSYTRDVDLAAFVASARATLDALPAGTGEPAEVFRKAANAALRTLDPHSRYIDPSTHARERAESGGSFGGVGLQVDAVDGGVRVLGSMPGTPAARAGLLAGDLIVRIDEQPLQGVALSDAVARMRGEPGSRVTVTVRRGGEAQEFTVALTRETIQRQLLTTSREDGVLFLRLGSFSGPVSAALQAAIDEAVAAGTPRGVVLDLRGNPGGLVREAVRTADMFLAAGEIVSLRARSPLPARVWQADADERLPGVPMVVLLDGRSASASELVAAALQENGRALVMGQRSLGKGTVQTTFVLGEGKGALKLTSATYHGPLGRSVQGVGVVPDVAFTGSRTAESTAGDAQAIQSKATVDPARCAAVQPAADPQMACALAYLRAGALADFLAVLPGGQAAADQP